MTDTSSDPLTQAELERDAVGSYYQACAAQAEMYAAGVTGMDVPIDPWTKADAAYWTATARYQPWKDVAAFFRESNSITSVGGE